MGKDVNSLGKDFLFIKGGSPFVAVQSPGSSRHQHGRRARRGPRGHDDGAQERLGLGACCGGESGDGGRPPLVWNHFQYSTSSPMTPI